MLFAVALFFFSIETLFPQYIYLRNFNGFSRMQNMSPFCCNIPFSFILFLFFLSFPFLQMRRGHRNVVWQKDSECTKFRTWDKRLDSKKKRDNTVIPVDISQMRLFTASLPYSRPFDDFMVRPSSGDWYY